ncbi:MAG: acyl-CoA thioesterase [Pyrinomonadaceae bacterium]|nr:acyl-CoA thioesterase [Pyrinomonadaceae bacterium]
MKPFIEFERRMRWADVDAAGILHFPRIFEIVEEAEIELLRRIGFSMFENLAEYDFPRVRVECDFKKMLPLDSKFRLYLTIGSIGRSTIRYDFKAFNDSNEIALDGKMTVAMLKDGKLSKIPNDLRAALEAH